VTVLSKIRPSKMSRPVNRSGRAKLCVSIDRGSKNTNLFFVSAAYGDDGVYPDTLGWA